ncbi:MAG: homoserine kinase [bacterium]
MKSIVRVRIPATSANLGPGFDCLGCALQMYNIIELQINPPGQKEKLHISIDGYGKDSLPRGKDNLVYKVIQDYFKQKNFIWKTMRLKNINRIPLARGLGSSAAARVGGLCAARELCAGTEEDSRLLETAAEDEGHADNVVPALYGGLCITRRDKQHILWWKEKIAQDLCAVVVIPDFEIKTSHARRLVPLNYARNTAVYTTSNAAFFVSAVTADPSERRDAIIKHAMKDKFHQPYRKHLISGMQNVFTAAEESGALGVALSGSGPSIIAIAGDAGNKDAIGRAMVNAFKKNNITSIYQILEFDQEGAHIL